MMIIERTALKKASSDLKMFPAVAIIGPRQVGKTTLAKQLMQDRPKSVYLDLERQSDLTKLIDPELYLGNLADHLVIIDEVQERPDLFPILRSLIDENRHNGRFLILGSASPKLLKQSSESLAGRISYIELPSFSLNEVSELEDDHNKLWLRGGYPLSYLSTSDDEAFNWIESFIRTHLTRDIPQLGIRFPTAQLDRFWRMIAHLHGQQWNASQLSGSLGVSSPTVKKYLDVLVDTFMVRTLEPWSGNLKKRLVRTPKVYMRDSGILHRLLGIESYDVLLGHPSAGASWEGFVVEQILACIPARTDVSFFRTAAGAEMDLVLCSPQTGNVLGIEVKLSLAPKPTKGFWLAKEDLGCSHCFVVYPGDECYPLSEDVTVLPCKQITYILKKL
jgi:predicted AAA+ superfamily ATPase